MAAIRKEFRLCETLTGVLYTVSDAYGMDGSWLPWQFERHILIGGATPFRITTKEYPRGTKEGVDKVSFEIHYDNDNPNLVKYIRFEELPARAKYIVTQTSMKHIEDDSTCPVWIEIPKGSDRDGIAGAQSLLKAKICCEDWKNHLPPSPETRLEEAHLTMAQEDIGWLKIQIISKNNKIDNLLSTIAVSKTEIDRLKAEVAKMDTLKQSIVELKAEIMTEGKAKDKAVDGLKGKLKVLNSDFDKLKARIKNIETRSKPNQDLDGTASMEVDSDLESPAPAANKRRRIALVRTPKNKGQANLKVPNTDPGIHGNYSTLQNGTGSQIVALTPGGTNIASRTPLPNVPRFQTAHFSLGDTAGLGRTRAATMASVQSSDYTPTGNNTRSGSVNTDSTLSSVDSDVDHPDIFI